MIEDLIKSNRSCRRFFQQEAVPADTLRWLVNLARMSASAANLQPLKYVLSNDPHQNDMIFSCLKWAAYLKDWPGPPEGERPSAYIIMVGDFDLAKNFSADMGIAAQSILLGATERGLGGCIIASVQREALAQDLQIQPRYEILLVLALGKPVEQVFVEPVGDDGDIRYWRDQEGGHHVPKRSLADIVIA